MKSGKDQCLPYSFGRAITSITCVNMLVQEHYAGNWDILRPAKEVEDYSLVTADELKTLMQEAELIMEGWENSYETAICGLIQ